MKKFINALESKIACEYTHDMRDDEYVTSYYAGIADALELAKRFDNSVPSFFNQYYVVCNDGDIQTVKKMYLYRITEEPNPRPNNGDGNVSTTKYYSFTDNLKTKSYTVTLSSMMSILQRVFTDESDARKAVSICGSSKE